jgi:hypothetical protein
VLPPQEAACRAGETIARLPDESAWIIAVNQILWSTRRFSHTRRIATL